jgi:hypothetical protein
MTNDFQQAAPKVEKAPDLQVQQAQKLAARQMECRLRIAQSALVFYD